MLPVLGVGQGSEEAQQGCNFRLNASLKLDPMGSSGA